MSTDNSTGRVAVITGASSGIGEATAHALAADGHRVALLARRADRIQALADQLGDGAIAIEGDVTDRDSMVAGGRARAAGPGRRRHPGQQRRGDAARLHLRPAHRAPADGREPARRDDRHRGLPRPAPKRRRRPHQPLVGGRAHRAAGKRCYAATKWGMNGWSESLRQELRPDIRVMVIEPGGVATELTDHITHSDTKQATEKMYDEISITAQDIAEVIAFSVSRPRRMTLNEILVRPTGQKF